MPIVHTAGKSYLNDYASQLKSFVLNFLTAESHRF